MESDLGAHVNERSRVTQTRTLEGIVMAAARARWEHRNGLARFSALVDSAFHGTWLRGPQISQKKKRIEIAEPFLLLQGSTARRDEVIVRVATSHLSANFRVSSKAAASCRSFESVMAVLLQRGVEVYR